jgi:hypothetical protein
MHSPPMGTPPAGRVATKVTIRPGGVRDGAARSWSAPRVSAGKEPVATPREFRMTQFAGHWRIGSGVPPPIHPAIWIIPNQHG